MSNDKSTASDTVNTYARQTAQGHQEALVTLTKKADTREKAILVESPYVIPVIFVPGVMGSNLKKKGNRDLVWRPPNGKADGIGTLANFYFKKTPTTRQILFNPLTAEVDKEGPIDPGATGLSEAVLKERGWGSVHMDSYGQILVTLHHTLNNLYAQPRAPVGAAPTDEFMYRMLEDPTLWGSVSRNTQLTVADLQAMGRYRFEVWACGYNWLQSNQDSGKELDAFIRATLKKYENPGGKPIAKQVILVTHSMGGLVVRGMLSGVPDSASRVLGVIHGVQPASGAPSAYKRMRAGFEGVLSGILGVSATEAVPELANAPALLEMLPFATYNDGKPWLSTSDPKRLSLPQSGNPFKDIYASTAWYGLIPEQNTKLIDPAGMVAKRIGPDKPIRENFTDTLADVRSFQNAITQYGYHPQTHVYCGVEHTRKTWGRVQWDGYIGPEVKNVAGCALLYDTLAGNIKLSGL